MMSHVRLARKERKPAVYFSQEQRERLERYYIARKVGNGGPKEKENIAHLSRQTGLSTQQIRGWLRNRKVRGAYKGKTVYHPQQIRALEWLFAHHSNYPTSDYKKLIADHLGMSYKQVKKWYQSRRQKEAPSPMVEADTPGWPSILASLKELIGYSATDDVPPLASSKTTTQHLPKKATHQTLNFDSSRYIRVSPPSSPISPISPFSPPSSPFSPSSPMSPSSPISSPSSPLSSPMVFSQRNNTLLPPPTLHHTRSPSPTSSITLAPISQPDTYIPSSPTPPLHSIPIQTLAPPPPCAPLAPALRTLPCSFSSSPPRYPSLGKSLSSLPASTHDIPVGPLPPLHVLMRIARAKEC